MDQEITRRSFLSRASLALAGATSTAAMSPISWAVDAVRRVGKPQLMLSLAAYSFRQYFTEGKGTEAKADPGRRIDMMKFVEYCAEQQCAAECTSYYFPARLTDGFLLDLKRRAFLLGVEISGTAVGNTFTHQPGAKRDAEIKLVKEWVDHAAVMGAPHIRVFAGNAQGTSKEQAKELCIGALEECCDYAGRKGVVLGIENHGGIVAECQDLLDIVRAVKSPWCGINFDTGNFHTDDPYADLERIAPYAVNVQWKAEVQPRSAKQKQAADLKRIVKILREANYRGYIALEYEAAEDPWTAVPRLLKQMREVLTA
jgi:sugar phosphate isomerase/epimerase